MTRVFAAILLFGLTVFAMIGEPVVMADAAGIEDRDQSQAMPVTGIDHVILIWFENKENTSITAASAPFFASFAGAGVNFTEFYGMTHPSQPNYINLFAGSALGVTTNNYCTFPVGTNSLPQQLAAAGKSWRVYAQNFPGGCSDVTTFTGGVDLIAPGGNYDRKHNPAIPFEGTRLTPAQCANIQPLANFDPLVNFAFVVPNNINSMHDGTVAQGNTFLQTFMPLVMNSPDWAHTLVIVSFDEGTSNLNGGGHIWTAARAPWLSSSSSSTFYNHHSVLRTIEDIYGLPYLNGAATATTITELFPPTPTFTPTNTPTFTPANTATNTATATATNTATFTPTITPSPAETPSISGTVTYGNAASPPKYISNVTVTGSGSPSVSSTTDAPGGTAGQYSLTGFGEGSYTVSLLKTTGVNGINSFDAARVAQHVAGTGPGAFTTDSQMISADVTNNGAINSFDAGKIAQYVAGLSSPPNFTGVWRFFVPNPTFPLGSSPTSRTYSSVTSNITGDDYVGLLGGEVTGNWTPSAARSVGSKQLAVGSAGRDARVPAGQEAESIGSSQLAESSGPESVGGRQLTVGSGPERGIVVELQDVVVGAGKEVVIPVNVQGVAGKGVISYEFDLRYDPSVIQPVGDVVDVMGTVSRGLSVVVNPYEPGRLRVAVYGAMPIEENGVLLNLRFASVGNAGSVSPLTIERMMFNDGESRVVITDGKVELF